MTRPPMNYREREAQKALRKAIRKVAAEDTLKRRLETPSVWRRLVAWLRQGRW